jgi:hypothetical protein
MSANIKCPSCGHEFEATDAFREEVQRELNSKAKEWLSKKEEEFRQKEISFQQILEAKEIELINKIAEEKLKLQKELQESIRKSVLADYENELNLLKQSAADADEKLKLSRKKELEYLQKESELKRKEEELELQLKRKINEEREKLSLEIRNIEKQRLEQLENDYKLKLAEKEKQLEDQKKLAEEMKRKAEQGSMQLQGEVQELALEEMLRSTFPFDIISEVGKGVRGADCIQTVRNNFGQECGKIIFESKRTSSFTNEWIEKLKTDMRSLSADIAVIVTKAMPKDMDCFGVKDGVWICTFSEVRALTAVLRDGVIRVFNAAKSNENTGDKMQLLYTYLTSNEFAEQWKAIREGFMNMKISIQKERDAMEKLWKAREKQLEKVLLNAAHIRGSIEGISGLETVDLNLLEDVEEDTESKLISK